MVVPSALLSHWPRDCEHFIKWNSNNGVQRDQLSFWLAVGRQFTVGREIKWRGRPDFLTKKTSLASTGYLTTCGYEKLWNLCQLEIQEGGAAFRRHKTETEREKNCFCAKKEMDLNISSVRKPLDCCTAVQYNTICTAQIPSHPCTAVIS